MIDSNGLSFRVTDKTLDFIREIVVEMTTQNSITEMQCIALINNHWSGQDLSDPDDIVYHQLPTYWAKHIYQNRRQR